LALLPRFAETKAAMFRPHPPRADGERDGELEKRREKNRKDPIQLVWMVNKNPATVPPACDA
jgi:hypothetical protein